MPDEYINVAGRFFEAESDELADSGDFDVDPADSTTGAFEVHNIAHGAACDVKLLVDPDDDGTYEVSVTLDSFSGEGVSQGNQIEVAAADNMLLRITNTSGGAADFVVTGREVAQ